MNLSRIREEIESYAAALSREEYLTRAGLKDESRTAAIRERFAVLGSPAFFQEVRGEAETTGDAERARSCRVLAEFLGASCVEYRGRAVADRLSSAEARQTIAVEGERVALRAADVRIRNESDRPRRAVMEAARLQAIGELNGLRAEMLETHHVEAARLGFPDYTAFCRSVSGVDPAAVRDLLAPVLPATLDAYRDLLGWYLKRWVGVEAREARRHDLGRLLRAAELDPLFPPPSLRDAAESPVRRMGIDPSAGGRIRVDAEARPTKVARAFVAALRVPDEVVLVVRPAGGPDDYVAYLHELGHALHFGYTDPRLPVEFRRLGDPSVTEAWAFLQDGLLRERGWLKRFLSLPRPGEVLRFTAFHKLWLLRRYTAKLEYELFLHAHGGIQAAADAYRALLSGATLVDWPRELYLADLDPFFYAARYLRAWVFEAQLKAVLRERFDEEWYRNDRTGPFLLSLWRQGQRRSLDELASDLGLGEPSIEPLLKQIMEDF